MSSAGDNVSSGHPPVERGQAELLALMSMAKIAPSEAQPVAQCVHFARQQEGDQLMLLELDEALLNRLIEGSDSLQVKGEPDQDAVLCTNECTYEVREVETSNSLLLSTDLLLPPDTAKAAAESAIQVRRCHVTAVKHSYLELRRIRPGPAALSRLLEPTCYRGLVEEADATAEEEAPPRAGDSAPGFAMADLRLRFQASDSELAGLLAGLGAIELDGRVRLLHGDVPHQVLTALIAAAGEHGWPLEALPAGAACAAVAELHDPRVARCVLETHSRPAAAGGGDLVALDSLLVSRSFGQFLLSHASAYKLDTFLQLWQGMVSDAATVSLDHLAGLCLLDEMESTVRYFPADRLPDGHQQRFAELFKAKAKWTQEEILPYLDSVCFERTTPGSLLARYARVSASNGRKCYSAR